jgi:tripartite-type tricarboxylate transporter receptor subunit TctC
MPAFLWALAVLSGLVSVAHAQPVPRSESGPATMRLVVPFPPGGGAGTLAAAIAPALGAATGAQVSVEYVSGKDGQLGTRMVATAPADGRTLLLGSTASLLAPGLVTGGRIFDPVTEFEPVAIVAKIPRVIAVHPSLPVKTMDDLVRLVRTGGPVRCGFADALGEFASVEFGRLTGTTLRCVDYDGITERMRDDVMSGRINLTFESAFIGDVQRGALLPLAVASTWRMPSLPQVPTTSEAGIPGLEAVAWLALLAPPRTPAPVVATLREAALGALATPAVRDVLQQRGYVVRPLSPVQTREFLQADADRWRKALTRRVQPRSHIPSAALAMAR